MSFSHSTCSNPNITLEGDEPEGPLRRPDAPNELSYNMVLASTDILAQEAKIMDAWTQALEDRDGEDVFNVDEDL